MDNRKIIIKELRDKGKAYVEIGKILGISKQRVHQIYKNYSCNKVVKKANKYKKRVCQICGSSKTLQIHHIDRNRKNNNKNNLITLCNSCHHKVENQTKRELGIKDEKRYYYEGRPSARKPKITLVCKYCKKDFKVHPFEKNRKYCSTPCYIQDKKAPFDRKTMNKIHMKNYYLKNKKKIKRYNEKYYQENKEKIEKRNKEYRQENKEKVKEHCKEYYQKNIEKIRAKDKKRYRKKKLSTVLSFDRPS